VDVQTAACAGPPALIFYHSEETPVTDLACYSTVYAGVCQRSPTTIVEHRDGEHLPYCDEHAALWIGRVPTRPIANPPTTKG
jgi:hypothetical protein